MKNKTVWIVALVLAVLGGGAFFALSYDSDYSNDPGYSVTENHDGHDHEHAEYGVR